VSLRRDYREDLTPSSGCWCDSERSPGPDLRPGDIGFRTGPPSIRNENGQLVGFVFVDVTTDDIDG